MRYQAVIEHKACTVGKFGGVEAQLLRAPKTTTLSEDVVPRAGNGKFLFITVSP